MFLVVELNVQSGKAKNRKIQGCFQRKLESKVLLRKGIEKPLKNSGYRQVST